MSVRHTNHLAREKSPYLLQHAHNPVDWFAWNDAAFAKARAENKPILLSIGYSTCHWCHVMERESFEDEAVGRYLNEHFVSIKVDREERPDVDKIYMTFVQSTTGSGGWPLNVFLTPDLKPFFGGTYFPPENRHARPSFLALLAQINDVWRQRHGEVQDSAAELHARLELATTQAGVSSGPLSPELLRHAGQMFKQMFDPINGGFGDAPKFPQPSIPSALLRYARRFADPEAVRMVLQTCDHMAAGGIHDQLGGGFARYSVDAEWLVPHFEKMLYDNAQLVQLYLDAHLLTLSGQPLASIASRSADHSPSPKGEGRGEGETTIPASARTPRSGIPSASGSFQENPFPQGLKSTPHAAVARDILGYVLRDLTHPAGGFYSAEDADSEGHEGKFYCWTRAELAALLTPAEFTVANRYYGLTDHGNFTDHSHPAPLPNQNVLSIVNPALAPGEPELLASAKAKMTAARARRIRPHLDDKVLASWNGLMLGAFARAYAVLGDEAYRAAAEKNLAFIQANLWRAPGAAPGETGTLYHRWREGEHDHVQLLEAYAFLLAGVTDLYEATLAPAHLEFAVMLAEALVGKFYDPVNGGFWQSGPGATDLILRVKDDYDGAEPSGNSVATLALLRLGAITGHDKFTHPASATLQLFAARLEKVPQAVPYLLHALDFRLGEPLRLVIAGDPQTPAARALLRAAHAVYQPNKVVLGNLGPVDPFARTLPAPAGPLAYLCTGTACQTPTSDPAVLAGMLQG
jgi:uncharacterized protein YyaL (SSP411 family)